MLRVLGFAIFVVFCATGFAEGLPEPPQQKVAWKAERETKLPAGFVSACEKLFELGVADPRGCEYREVKVHVGSVWSGDGGKVKVHAWVVPEKEGGRRFAVTWNGLVSAVEEVGAAADVKKDVEAACEAFEKVADQRTWRFGTTAEAVTVSEGRLMPMKACLLLRLGERALAERVWGDIYRDQGRGEKDADRFAALAADWLWAKFDRAVTAHMRGEDALSVEDAKSVLAVRKAVEAEIATRGAKAENERGLEFLDPAEALVKDGERRLKEKGRVHVLETGLEKFPDKRKRIAALIDDLDQVSARQMGQPGGVSLADDAVVQALVREGEAAVDPLLECLEKDDRLTRSVHFWRDFSRHRSLLRVHEAAYVAIANILKQEFFATGSTGDDLSARQDETRKQLVKAIRDYWHKNKDKPLEERWYAALSDNGAGMAQWAQAAHLITQDARIEEQQGSMFGAGWVTVPALRPGEKPTLRGEVLRNRSMPSVSELLVRRLEEVPEDNQGLQQVAVFAEALAAWDGKAHLAELGAYHKKLLAAYRAKDPYRKPSARLIAHLAQKRHELGDKEALKEYAGWVRETTPKDLSFDVTEALAPLWVYWENKDIAAATEAMFNGEGSPWNPIDQENYGARTLGSPLMGLPAVQKQMLRQLENKAPVATASLQSDGRVLVKRGSVSSSQDVEADEAALLPVKGEVRQVRACDVVAGSLGRMEGFPRIEMYWPEAKRDEVVRAAGEMLRRYGHRMRWVGEARPETSWAFERAKFRFGALERPATAEDVAKGDAVFSLEGERRVWKMPAFPLKARWNELHTKRWKSQRYDEETGKTEAISGWYQDGTVWQAEEVNTGGTWERWFGFVGQGFMGKVPAREVELEPADNHLWLPAGEGVQVRVEPPEGKPVIRAENWPVVVGVSAGGKIVAKLRVRNVLGVAQAVPAEWYRASDHGLRKGFRLHVERLKGPLTKLGRASEWDKVPLKMVTLESEGKRVLGVLEELPVVEIDLGSLGVKEKGVYRWWITRGVQEEPMYLRVE